MPTKPTKRLLSSSDNGIPSQINMDLQAQAEVPGEDCPWVEIGNLYVSLTMIGETSWLPLISRLHATHKQYKVFTGRHGDIPNKVDQKGTTIGVFSQEHVQEDKDVKNKALAEFKDIKIELADAGTIKSGHTNWLKSATISNILEGNKVIYAWCYGLFTMCEISNSVDATRYQNEQNILINKSIKTLVKQYWDWVK